MNRLQRLEEVCRRLHREYETEEEQYGFPFSFGLRDAHRELLALLSEDEKDFNVEALADYAHEAWSEWMGYLFSQCEKKNLLTRAGIAEKVQIPSWAVERWTRQMNAPYSSLPENEKESDRIQARKILAILDARVKERKRGT